MNDTAFKKKMKLAFTLVLLFSSFSIAQPIFAKCGSNQCLLENDLKKNPYIVSYTISNANKNTETVTGQLKDGYKFKIVSVTGNVLSKNYKKIIPFSSKRSSLSNQTYWMNQAIGFADQVWKKSDVAFLKENITQKKFSVQSSGNKLRLERYVEGYFESIQITQTNKETVIELQQSAC